MLQCPYCKSTGAFCVSEKIWVHYDLYEDNEKIFADVDSFNPDLEQEAEERRIECLSCFRTFDPPDGVDIEFL